MAYKFIKKEGIRKVVHERDFQASKRFFDALEAKVSQMIEEACSRAQESRRRTLLGQDV